MEGIPMTRPKCSRLCLGLSIFSGLWAGHPPQHGKATMCETVVATLTTDFTYRSPLSSMARVEVRQCEPLDRATLQIVAWGSGASIPALVENTGDFGIVQLAGRQDVYVIETGGSTRDQVFVVTFRNGIPGVALRRVTRGSAVVQISDTELLVRILGIFAGDAPSRTEEHRFPVNNGTAGR